MSRVSLSAALGLAALAFTFSAVESPARAAEVRGAGSTFAYPIIWKWSQVFREKTGNVVGYQAVGSSAGVARMKEAVVEFGATDRPLKPQELDALGLGQFPIVFGGVVPVFNLDGIGPGGLKFTGAVLADIYLGKITKWSDPALKALNPGAPLPDAPIVVVERAEGSGTTFNFTTFLARSSPDWQAKVGAGSAVAWPVGTGARGNEGVALEVRRLKNAIGYVEFTYVVQAKLAYGLVQNRSGAFIAPSAASFQAAAMAVDWASAKDFSLVISDSPAPDAYPIAATTFALMSKTPANPAVTRAAFDFWRFAFGAGEDLTKDFGYVPLPPALVEQVKAYWAATFKQGA